MPVATAATSTPAQATRTGSDITSYGAPARPPRVLLLVPALDARLLQQLAVLLLCHALAALLDDRAHETTPSWALRMTSTPTRSPGYGRLDTQVTRAAGRSCAQPRHQTPASGRSPRSTARKSRPVQGPG